MQEQKNKEKLERKIKLIDERIQDQWGNAGEEDLKSPIIRLLEKEIVNGEPLKYKGFFNHKLDKTHKFYYEFKKEIVALLEEDDKLTIKDCYKTLYKTKLAIENDQAHKNDDHFVALTRKIDFILEKLAGVDNQLTKLNSKIEKNFNPMWF